MPRRCGQTAWVGRVHAPLSPSSAHSNCLRQPSPALGRAPPRVLCFIPSLPPPVLAGRRSLAIVAGNPGSGGPFAPLVIVTRNIMGTKEFNQFRGKMISLHSQGGQTGKEPGCCCCWRPPSCGSALTCSAQPASWQLSQAESSRGGAQRQCTHLPTAALPADCGS